MTDKEIASIPWFHSMPIGDGRYTLGSPNVDEAAHLFDMIDFTDKSVLDIGCWDGYFSFRAEQRGAKRVVGLDDPDLRWGGMSGFNALHAHFKSSVEWRKGNVYTLPSENFDIVLCYGVLYHLSDPLLASVNCFQRANEMVAFEGEMLMDDRPVLELLPVPYMNDASNIFTMSSGFLISVGHLCGFKLVKRVHIGRNRGAVLFKALNKTACPYLSTCFTFKPAEPIV